MSGAAPSAVRGQYSDLYGSSMLPVLEELFSMELARHPSRREALFQSISHDRDIWQYSELQDMDLFPEVAEGTEISFKRSKQGSNKTISPSKFALGFSISQEAVDDGKFDLVALMVRKLARSARETQEIDAMNTFNNGFGSAETADGVSLFNLAHPLPSGGSYRNRLSTDSDLSQTALDTMLTDYETQFVGDSGIISDIRPRWLVVHPSQKRFAMELVGSELKPDTSDNNLNAFRQDGIEVLSSPHLTDLDAWFLVSQPDDNGLRIIMREALQTKAAGPDVGFSTDSILYKARYREKIAPVHGYGSMGTPGAA